MSVRSRMPSSRLPSDPGGRRRVLIHASALLSCFRLTLIHTQCHFRLTESRLACGDVAGATSAYDHARLVFADQPLEEGLVHAFDAIGRRLRPCLTLPEELLAFIFELVYADWEQLPSPFQLCHVNSRWRTVANATKALWRDTRILRIATVMPVEGGDHSSTVRKPFCFPPAALSPGQYVPPGPKNHVALLRWCACQTENTLSYFELETASANFPFRREVLKIAENSAPTLVGISIISRDQDLAASTVFELVFQCPLLADLQISTKSMSSSVSRQLREKIQKLPMPVSLRRLRLDGIVVSALPPDSPIRGALLQRCHLLESLTLIEDRSPRAASKLANFGADCLDICAEHLVEIEVSSCNEMFAVARERGVLALPQLRRYRHITTAFDRALGTLSIGMDLPALETVEGPLHMLLRPAACVVVRYNHIFTMDWRTFDGWLRKAEQAHEGERLQDLTLELCADPNNDSNAELNTIIEILTPSLVGKVFFPRLRSLSILLRYEHATDAPEACLLDTDCLPRPRPVFRDEWQRGLDVSLLVTMESERRAIADALSSDRSAEPAATVSPGHTPGEGARTAAAAEAGFTLECVALERITIEGCCVTRPAWAAMKASPCRFTVTPDPDEMAQLPHKRDASSKRVKFNDESDA